MKTPVCIYYLYIFFLTWLLFFSCQRPQEIELVRGDCPAGSVKVGKDCFVTVGQMCEKTNDCIGGFCLANYQEKYCTQRCNYDYDCPLGYFCSKVGSDKLCVKSIYSRKVCSKDYECEPCGMCINGLCELSNFCVVTLCESDEDCGSCRICSDGRCIPIDRCGRGCLSNMDCDSSQICDRDYQGRLACIPKSPGETGMYCEGRSFEKECKDGVCLFTDGYAYSYCSRFCSDNSDCPYDFYCGIFPTYPERKVCIKKGTYAPTLCSSSRDCEFNLKCRYSFSYDKSKITTFCGILNSGVSSRDSCDRYYECRWGMCGRPLYCRDYCMSLCTMPCKEDFDCPEGFVCEDMLSNDGDVPYKGCVHYKDVKKDIGEFCTYSNDECKSSICVKNSDIPYCSKSCSDNFDCPSNYVCDIFEGAKVCQKMVSENQCYKDSDCLEGSFCAYIDEGSNRYIGCKRPEGKYSMAGESCIYPCASGICISETMTCSAFCVTREDCPAGYICVFAELNLDFNNKTVVKVCLPDPGSLYPCVRSEGCPSGETCKIYFDSRSGEIEPVCMKLYSALKGYQDECHSNEECQSGVCLPESNWDINLGYYGRCTKFCATDEDCSNQDVCRIVPVYISKEYAKAARVCAPKSGVSSVGRSCKDNPYICDSGFCANVDLLNAFCTERCRHHFDCVKSLTVCRFVDKIGTICLPITYMQEE